MKAKYNLYIQQDLQPLLDKEENMSGLVNDLLREHFNKRVPAPHRPLRQEDINELGKAMSARAKKIIKTKKDAEEIIPELVPPVAKNIDRYSNGLCKQHGTPLDTRGRCMIKGCKYS